jgi:Agrobacterium tumefaciens protein Atu4866
MLHRLRTFASRMCWSAVIAWSRRPANPDDENPTYQSCLPSCEDWKTKSAATVSAYQGRYWLEADHIEYVDDTGFTADVISVTGSFITPE